MTREPPQSFGFYPAEDGSPTAAGYLNTDAPGLATHIPESAHTYSYWRTFQVNDEQYAQALQYYEAIEKSPPQYNVNPLLPMSHCATVALSLLEQLGLPCPPVSLTSAPEELAFYMKLHDMAVPISDPVEKVLTLVQPDLGISAIQLLQSVDPSLTNWSAATVLLNLPLKTSAWQAQLDDFLLPFRGAQVQLLPTISLEPSAIATLASNGNVGAQWGLLTGSPFLPLLDVTGQATLLERMGTGYATSSKDVPAIYWADLASYRALSNSASVVFSNGSASILGTSGADRIYGAILASDMLSG